MNIYRHKKTGHIYIFLMKAYLESNSQCLVIYQRAGADDSKIWARPVDEFFDGRFELLDMEKD